MQARYRTVVTLVAAFALGGIALATSASAMVPVLDTAPGPVVGATPASTGGSTDATTCPPAAPSAPRAQLPRLGTRLADALRRYAQDPPANASVSSWYDSGGPFGGGVPASAVSLMMRKGLGYGLTQGQVLGFLNPSLLRGINDPYGGGAVLRFIAARGDELLYQQLSDFAGGLGGRSVGSMSAQRLLFESFPQLGIVYMAQAGAAPIDEAGASYMVDLARGGYGPARRTIDQVLAAGNRPPAGAQDSGGVAYLVDPAVYDVFAITYDGPLSAAARQAVANRRAYVGWAGRIDDWRAAGSDMAEVPQAVTFPVSPSSTTPSSTAPTSSCP